MTRGAMMPRARTQRPAVFMPAPPHRSGEDAHDSATSGGDDGAGEELRALEHHDSGGEVGDGKDLRAAEHHLRRHVVQGFRAHTQHSAVVHAGAAASN